MNLVISKCVTAVKVSNFTCHYLRNRSTLDIGVLGYIGIVYHKEHPPEVWSFPPVTPCTYIHIYIYRKGESGLYSIEGRYLQKAGYTESTAE